jgi:hypothetical protein
VRTVPSAKHQLNLDPNPEGTQKTLGARRYGGREEQRIPRVGESAGAARGVPCVGLLSSAEFLFLGSVLSEPWGCVAWGYLEFETPPHASPRNLSHTWRRLCLSPLLPTTGSGCWHNACKLPPAAGEIEWIL